MSTISKEFVLAGKAIFTCDNGQGQHHTFKVTHKPASGQYKDSWFVKVLTGPDNTSNYTYLGLLDATTGNVILTRKSQYTDETLQVRVVRWALGIVWGNGQFPQGYSVRHAGRCGRCGRLLTVPASLESGFGPECEGRI